MSSREGPSYGFDRGLQPDIGQRVRFRSTSAFARDMGLTPGCVGIIAACYSEDGRQSVNVQIEGGPYCFGVAAEEVMMTSDATRPGQGLRHN